MLNAQRELARDLAVYLLSQKHVTVFVPLILPQDQRLSSTFTTTCTHSCHRQW